MNLWCITATAESFPGQFHVSSCLTGSFVKPGNRRHETYTYTALKSGPSLGLKTEVLSDRRLQIEEKFFSTLQCNKAPGNLYNPSICHSVLLHVRGSMPLVPALYHIAEGSERTE